MDDENTVGSLSVLNVCSPATTIVCFLLCVSNLCVTVQASLEGAVAVRSVFGFASMWEQSAQNSVAIHKT